MKGFFSILMGLSMLAGLVWVGTLFYRFLARHFSLLDPQNAAFVILTASALAACTLFLGWSFRVSLRKYALGNRSERGAVYSDFIMLWFPNAASGLPLEEWGEEWRSLRRRLALLASGTVLAEYHRLLKTASESAPSNTAASKQAERLVQVMRRDMFGDERIRSPEKWEEMLA